MSSLEAHHEENGSDNEKDHDADDEYDGPPRNLYHGTVGETISICVTDKAGAATTCTVVVILAILTRTEQALFPLCTVSIVDGEASRCLIVVQRMLLRSPHFEISL